MRSIMIDHRMKEADRRSWSAEPNFPILDSNNQFVSEDRRVYAERRGYELSEISLEDVLVEAINLDELH